MRWSSYALLFAMLCGGVAATAQQPAKPSESIGFNPAGIDASINPCNDFYRYACDQWMAGNPIPADQPEWSRFGELAERNRAELRKLLEANSPDAPNRDDIQTKVGDFYYACMNQSAVDKLGDRPVQPLLRDIAGLTTRADLVQEIARLHHQGIDALFNFGSDQDFHDATQVIAVVDQGGLGLPDRDYYLKTDAKSVKTRQQYQAHVAKMFELMGDTPAQARSEADTVLRIETGLAKASMSRVDRRDPHNIYHKMTPAQFEALAPGFNWNRYFSGMDAPHFGAINVTVPAFFTSLNKELDAVPLSDWKTYLRWHVIHYSAPFLSTPFVNAHFDFYGKTLTGQAQLSPRWKRCVRYTDGDLGEALGQLYVKAVFGPDARQRTHQMVLDLERALSTDINQLTWMTPATKSQAQVKLQAIVNKIGYPDKWRDYSSVVVKRDDLLGNDLRANVFEVHRELNKIGRPVDRTEWGMTPPTVNAYYNPQMNEIVFPAGILQPPFFDNQLDDAVNFGGIGAVIGHELTHGFDDEGRQFGPHGNLHDWWTKADSDAFETRVACIVHEYSQFLATDDIHLNGKLTLGENTADNGGLRIAYMALMNQIAGKPQPKLDGLTPEQRFFLSWGQIWCENRRPAFARMLATVDSHSPGKDRVNGVVSNMPEFQKAFHCSENAPMVLGTKACHVW